MLKHYSIISQLSEKDKIRLLTDISCLSSKEFKVLGIPEIKIAAADNYLPERYPSAVSLANSWDMNLISDVADDIYKTMFENDVGLISVPAPKLKIDPYSSALSEDPYLASAITREYLKAAKKVSGQTALDIGSISSNETEWLDDSPDQRFVHEFLFKPYIDSAKALDCSALFTNFEGVTQSYVEINALLASKAYTESIAKGATVICRRVSAEDTVLHIAGGGLCFEGSSPALESALMRYKLTKKAIERGYSTIEDLNTELALGKAISTDTVDEAIDRLIDFAFSVKRKPQFFDKKELSSLTLKACEKSTVLLKNEASVLPIKHSAKVCILGDLAVCGMQKENFLNDLSSNLNVYGYKYIGFSRGYNIKTDRSEELIAEALNLANQADIVLLFLGMDEIGGSSTVHSRKISIPANQQELLDRLSAIRDKIVAILPPDHSPDIGLEGSCTAMLLAPINTESGAKALANILSGKVSPSGKLSSTVYVNTEEHYSKHKTRRTRDKIKVGPFIGYRYYDLSGEPQPFPFGHGLSYTHFSYSRLSIHNGKVKFFIKNDGKVSASEVVQLYIGIENPKILTPQKELCGFTKIDLAPGEKKSVEMPLNILQIYDEKSSSFIEPAEIYNIYVCSSSADIRLTQKIRAGTITVEADGRNTVDYIHTQSNIISDNFKLEAKVKVMKKSIFNFISGSITLLLAIALKMYCIASNNDSPFFDYFAIALGFLGLILFISEAIRRSKIHKTQREEIDKATEENFSDAENVSKYNAAAMFVKEFDTDNEKDSNIHEHYSSDIDDEQIAYIDKSQNFASAASEFEIFAASRGLKFSPSVIKKVFSSIAASRLIVINSMNDNEFKTFMTVLSNYFETVAYIDRVDSSYVGTENLLFKYDSSYSKVKTQTLFAIEAARNASHNIHFAALTNVKSAELTNYFSAYINHVKNPDGKHYVSITNEKNAEMSYYIPRNLWFVLNLAEDETPESLPDFIRELATVNTFTFSECAPLGQYPNIKKFSYHQMELLTEKIGGSYCIKEENWKKVDKLEDYLSGASEFKIGNKTWLCLEKFASVFMASGGEENEALDEAICAKLIVPAIAAYKESADKFDKPLGETLDAIFGTDSVNSCLKMIKHCFRT